MDRPACYLTVSLFGPAQRVKSVNSLSSILKNIFPDTIAPLFAFIRQYDVTIRYPHFDMGAPLRPRRKRVLLFARSRAAEIRFFCAHGSLTTRKTTARGDPAPETKSGKER
jgi:hypothetical protein